ncbi:MAG: DNA polymerase II [Bdellovibrio sp.]
MKQLFILSQNTRDIKNRAHITSWTIADDGERKYWEHEIAPTLYANKPFLNSQLSSFRAFDAGELFEQSFSTFEDWKKAKEEVKAKGIQCYESDVRANEAFMMDRGLSTFVQEQHGQWQPAQNVFTPCFRILSLDIETLKNGEVASIALSQSENGQRKKIVLIQGAKLESQDEIVVFSDEALMLRKFFEVVSLWDPDIIIGWNVIGFDLIFLEERARYHRIDFRLGRKGEISRFFKLGQRNFIRIEGRVVLDGPDTLRSHFFSFESFKLESVAQELLGRGKLITDTGADKWNEIERQYYHSPLDLCRYNLMDADLVIDIFEKAELLSLITERSRLSGMTFDRINSSTGAFDFAMLPHFHREGIRLRDVMSDEEAEGIRGLMGGLVLDPMAGLYRSISVFDFRSLYPSIIRTFHIDPWARKNATDSDIILPNGVKFSREHHFLPAIIEGLLEKRAVAQARGEKQMSQAIKILMNSFYGVLGSLGCRFYDPYVAGSITSTGQWVLTQSKKFLEEQEKHQVIYGDTDSLFVQLNKTDNPIDYSKKLAKQLNDFWSKKLQDEFKIESFLEIKFEKNFSRFVIPQMRDGSGGAKKRYAGLKVLDDHQTELEIVGLEYVRSDWSEVAKRFQYQLLEKVFRDEDVEQFIKSFVDSIQKCPLSDFVYKKRLSKSLDEYDKTQPPHVKAALRYQERNLPVPRVIEYVMTIHGPWPYDLNPSQIDFDHYLEKQLGPLADSILVLIGKKFSECISGGQMSLF